MQLSSGDRLLVLGVPPAADLEAWSRQVSGGLIACLGGDEEVRAARRAFAHLENVMFTPGSADEIPWRDELFTVIVDLAPERSGPAWVKRELLRVLAPGGACYAARAPGALDAAYETYFVKS